MVMYLKYMNKQFLLSADVHASVYVCMCVCVPLVWRIGMLYVSIERDGLACVQWLVDEVVQCRKENTCTANRASQKRRHQVS